MKIIFYIFVAIINAIAAIAMLLNSAMWGALTPLAYGTAEAKVGGLIVFAALFGMLIMSVAMMAYCLKIKLRSNRRLWNGLFLTNIVYLVLIFASMAVPFMLGEQSQSIKITMAVSFVFGLQFALNLVVLLIRAKDKDIEIVA